MRAKDLVRQILAFGRGEEPELKPVSAEKVVKEAEGYHIGRVNRAEGDVSAFLAILTEYRKAPEVTRRRIYLEAMEEILIETGNITIIDESVRGILPVLNLDESIAPTATRQGARR